MIIYKIQKIWIKLLSIQELHKNISAKYFESKEIFSNDQVI